jgi:hypothetical protein
MRPTIGLLFLATTVAFCSGYSAAQDQPTPQQANPAGNVAPTPPQVPQDSDPRCRNLAEPSGEIKQKIDPLLAQLGDQSWETREEAMKTLAGIGWPAMLPLLRASLNDDAEVAWRAEQAAREIFVAVLERNGWLGISWEFTTAPAPAGQEGELAGITIKSVLPQQPAEKAGLKIGDVMVEFDGQKLETKNDLPVLILSTPPESRIKLKIIRETREIEIEAVIGTRPEGEALPDDQCQAYWEAWLESTKEKKFGVTPEAPPDDVAK